MLYLLSLIVLQAIWTSSYVAMKFALVGLPVGGVLILRYGFATLLLLGIGFAKGSGSIAGRDWIRIILLGIAVYSFSPFFQLKSLELTQVIDVSVLVSTEPFITALLASLLLREKLTWELVLIFLVATLGVLILSGAFSTETPTLLSRQRLLGNFLFFAALLFEGLNSVAGRGLTQRYPPQLIAFWTHLSGFSFNLAWYGDSLRTIPWESIPMKGWLAVIFLGLFCSALGYTAWYFLVQKVQVSRLALSLFLQPVMGSFLGYFLMGERLDNQTIVGGGLILLPLLFWVIRHHRHKASIQLTEPVDIH